GLARIGPRRNRLQSLISSRRPKQMLENCRASCVQSTPPPNGLSPMSPVDTRDDVLQTLTKCKLLSSEAIAAARSSASSPRDLLASLVQKGHLTNFQAETVLRGAADQLTLSQYTLVDMLGTGSLGPVYRARSSKDDGGYVIKTVPRKNV